MYRYYESRVYGLRSRLDLQHHHKRCFVYDLCHGLCSRKHLSVHGLYNDSQSHLYGLYDLCGRNIQKYHLYSLGQHRVYVLRGWVDLQYDDQRGIVYSVYDLYGWKIPIHCLYYDCQSNMYLVRRRNFL